jgi:hypothetical protein
MAAEAGRRRRAAVQTRADNELRLLLLGFAQRLATIRVLDPACGSGNFLYVALRLLLDLWKGSRHLLRRGGAVDPGAAAGAGALAGAVVRHRDQRLRPRTGAGHRLDRLFAVAARERLRLHRRSRSSSRWTTSS